jgi:hypothetical protein
MKTPRGYVLLLMMGALASICALGLVVAQRSMLEISDRRASGERDQALWLARSAAAQGKAGNWSVPLSLGPARAHVTVQLSAAGLERRAAAVASMPAGGLAQVKVTWDAQGHRTSWREHYARGP